MKTLRLVVLGTILLAIVGCQSGAPPGTPRPGRVEYQQKEAQKFDPYPENDIGPTVLGSRPLDYKEPRSEVRRAQWWQWDYWRLK